MYYMSDIHPYLGVPKLVYKPKPSKVDDDLEEINVKEVSHKPFEKSDFFFYECYDVSGELQYEKVEQAQLPKNPGSQIINIHKNYPECVHRMILYFSFVKKSTPAKSWI